MSSGKGKAAGSKDERPAGQRSLMSMFARVPNTKVDAPPRAAPTTATTSDEVEEVQPKPAAKPKEKEEPKAKKEKATKAAADSDAPAKKKPAAKKEKAHGADEEKPSSKKKATAASPEVKSPHFSSPSPSPPPASEKAASAATKPSKSSVDSKPKAKKRIRDEEADDDEVTIVSSPKSSAAAAAALLRSPAKVVVVRQDASPHKAAAPVAASAADFFGTAPIAAAPQSAQADLQKIRAKIEAQEKEAVKEATRQKLLAETAALLAQQKALEDEEVQAAIDASMADAVAAEAADQPMIIVTAPSPSPPAADAPMEDISADWQRVDAADALPTDSSGDDIEEIPKPPPKSPIKAATATPPPPKSPLQNSSTFTPYVPSDSARGSLSAKAAVCAPSPKKSPKRSPPSPAPKVASPVVKAASPASKPTAAKRAHAVMESVKVSPTPSPSTSPPPPAAASAMADMSDFGGASLRTNYDMYMYDDAEAADQPSPSKKQKTTAASTGTGTSEKKKFYVKPPPPANLGSKSIPIGKPNCLTGLTFVLTGTGDSLSREDAADLVKRYGGKVTTSLSGKTNYLVAGLEPGESKMKKAIELKTKIIDEDALLQLVRDKSQGWTPPSSGTSTTAGASSSVGAPPKPAMAIAAAGVALPRPQAAVPLATVGSLAEQAILRSGVQTAASVGDMLWVDAHRPLKVENIIGNPGLVKTITEWLSTWHAKRLHREASMTAKEQEKIHKALLISGPPGIGKSTAATVIARSLGFEVIEFNASDVRNKKSLEHAVGDITGNRGMTEFFGVAAANGAATSARPAPKKKSVIIMDEVDGMGGNEDRGGMQELVSLIKKTRTPMICIANDAGSPKMKTLKNYVEAITWKRVPAATIAPRIQEICRKEGLTIDRPSIEKLAESTQGDIRQILNFLQMFRLGNSKSISFDDVKARIEHSGKDFDLGPFDVVPGFFKPIPPTQPGKTNDWIGDRQNMYFVDSDIIPLFIQENYIHGRAATQGLAELKSNSALVQRTRSMPNGQQVLNDVLAMAQLAEAADSISMGDMINDSIFTEQDYSLQPVHAILSTVYPSYLMRGGFSERIMFPSWLGKQSTRNKFMRIAREFKTALTADIHADNNDIIMFVLPAIRLQLLQALQDDEDEGINKVIATLVHFGLDKDDFDQIMDWGEKFLREEDRYSDLIPSKVKAKLTRAWKEGNHVRKVARGGKADPSDVSRGRTAVFKESTDDAGDDVEEEVEPSSDADEAEIKALAAAGAKGKPAAKGKAKAASTKKPASATGAPKKPRAPRKPKAPGAAAASKKKAAPKDVPSDYDSDLDF